MSNDIDLIKQEIWKSLADKVRRDAFVASHLSDNVGSQIFALREARGWSQEKLAAEVGMAQPRISILEGGYDRYSLQTLKRFASVYDVAVIVRFVPYSELVEWVANLSEKHLAPVDFENDNLSETSIGSEALTLVETPTVVGWQPSTQPLDLYSGGGTGPSVESAGILSARSDVSALTSPREALPISPMSIGTTTPAVIGATGTVFQVVARTPIASEFRPTASGD